MPERVYVPAYITVHLGAPNEDAENVRIPFLTYVKNVASSEVYPTWPEDAIRANMYAQVTYALNRLFTEHYRTRGYDFDITGLPAYDQAYVYNRNIFEPMDKIGNEVFNDYIVRGDNVEPLFARYCDGKTSTCEGLSQWGTVDLAQRGFSPLDILKHYYGEDIRIIENAPIYDVTESYPGYVFRKGDTGPVIARIQNQLERVRQSYPNIPGIAAADGVFGEDTDRAVRAFQKIFNLEEDGIVGKQTWYKLLYVYNAVKKLADLHSEGIILQGVPKEFERTLRFGDTGKDVHVVQYFINNVASYNNAVPTVRITSTFDEPTTVAVTDFQQYVGLPRTGVVDRETFDALYDEYRGTLLTHEALFRETIPRPFPGYLIRIGDAGEEVRILQLYLLAVADHYRGEIPLFRAIGNFGDLTEAAVKAFQEKFGLPPTGIVNEATWNRITEEYFKIRAEGTQTAFAAGPHNCPFMGDGAGPDGLV
jgi:peptidoglycan hydrolase-like protein with peptidoglycan-binding domain